MASTDRAMERRTILILLIIYTLAYLDRQIITLLIDPIRRDLGVGDVEMGFLQGMGFTLFFALAGPFLGWMVDRYDRRVIIWAGVTIWSLSTAACGLANSYEQLLAARFGVGAGEAALLPGAYSIISDRVDRNRLSRALATFSLGAIVGGALSYGLGGGIVALATRLQGFPLPLLGSVAPWQLVFLLIGGLGTPMALLIFLIREPARRKRALGSRGEPGDRGHVRRHWRFYTLHIAAFSLMCMLTASHVAWAATFLIRDYHWSVTQVGGWLGTLSLVTGGIGMFGSGMLADWLYRRGWHDAHLRLYIVILPVMALAAVAAYTTNNILVTLAGFAVMGLGAAFIAVASAALQLCTPPERRGLMSAIFLMVYNLVGFGLGPAAMALISTRFFGPAGDIGAAIAWSYTLITPIAVLLFILGLKPMREAAREIEAMSAAQAGLPTMPGKDQALAR